MSRSLCSRLGHSIIIDFKVFQALGFWFRGARCTDSDRGLKPASFAVLVYKFLFVMLYLIFSPAYRLFFQTGPPDASVLLCARSLSRPRFTDSEAHRPVCASPFLSACHGPKSVKFSVPRRTRFRISSFAEVLLWTVGESISLSLERELKYSSQL